MTPVELLTNLVLFVNKIKTELKTVVKSPLKIKGEGLKTNREQHGRTYSTSSEEKAYYIHPSKESVVFLLEGGYR